MKYKDYFKNLKKDQGFYSTPLDILKSKTFTKDEKLVLIVIISDLEMNDKVKWAHETYADRTNISRRTIVRIFQKFEHYNLLLDPNYKQMSLYTSDKDKYKHNKPGSKNNYYLFSTHTLERLLKIDNSNAFKAIDIKKKKQETCEAGAQTCEAGAQTCEAGAQTCEAGAQTCEAASHIQINTDRIENTDLYREEDDDFSKSSSSDTKKAKELEAEDLDKFLDELNIQ